LNTRGMSSWTACVPGGSHTRQDPPWRIDLRAAMARIIGCRAARPESGWRWVVDKPPPDEPLGNQIAGVRPHE